MLMGNYHLLMVKSINSISEFTKALLNGNLSVYISSSEFDLLIYFLIFLIGSVIGLVAFSNIISVILNKYHDATIAILTGYFWIIKYNMAMEKEISSIEILDRQGNP